MEEYYVSGMGHFGDQNGDAGQTKLVWSTRDTLYTPSDRLQDLLLSRGIIVDVVDCRRDQKTGADVFYLFGLAQHYEAAAAFCLSHSPPIQVVHVEQIQRQHRDREQERFASGEAAVIAPTAASESTTLVGGHQHESAWDR